MSVVPLLPHHLLEPLSGDGGKKQQLPAEKMFQEIYQHESLYLPSSSSLQSITDKLQRPSRMEEMQFLQTSPLTSYRGGWRRCATRFPQTMQPVTDQRQR